jgi:hypothetical protein
MNVRFFQVGLCAAGVFALGCGGEASTLPPPDYASAPTAEAASNAPADKSTDAEKPEAKKPAAEPVEQPKAETPAPPVASTEKPAEKPQASDVPGANLSVGQLEADGLVTKNIECKSEGSGGGLGLLGMVLVTAWMSPLKKALDACAPAGAETRVVWKSSGGKVTEIQAKGDAKVKACVEKALRPGKPVFEGHCAATVVHGKK